MELKEEFIYYSHLNTLEDHKTFFAKIVDGKVEGIYGLMNLKSVIPNFNQHNPPKEWIRVVWCEKPKPEDLGPYTWYDDECTYILKDNNLVFQDWGIRPMTNEEILEKQQNVIDEWFSDPFNSRKWIFNYESCKFTPPIPYPEDYYSKYYRYDVETDTWKEDYYDPWRPIRGLSKELKENIIEELLKKADEGIEKPKPKLPF